SGWLLACGSAWLAWWDQCSGTHLSQTVNPDVLLLAFACVMLLVAWRMWVTARACGHTTSGASSDSNAPAGPAIEGLAPAGTPPPGRRIGSQVSTVAKVVVRRNGGRVHDRVLRGRWR